MALAVPDLGIARDFAALRRGATQLSAPSSPRALRAPAGTVLERRLVAPGLLVLRLSKPDGFVFEAGQSVKLALADSGHKYTIASSPDAPYLEFCIELVPNGRLTPRLFALRPGDQLRVATRAKGRLLLDDAVSDHLMFATVTGVAPFISMWRHELRAASSTRRFLLVHGASYADELVYRDELSAIASRLPHAEYVPAVSRPDEPRNAGFNGERGRLPSLSARLAQRFGLTPGNCRVYACGNPAMVEAIAAQFAAPGVPVTTESFWRV